MFKKAMDGFWVSIQTHLETLYKTESVFNRSVQFTEKFPFDSNSLDANVLSSYWEGRNALKDLFIDETNQLDVLIKVIRQKDYKEEDKRLLMIMILGCMDIAESIFAKLDIYKSYSQIDEDELQNCRVRFERLKKFVQLNIRGIMPKF